jgi:hypothetical protein
MRPADEAPMGVTAPEARAATRMKRRDAGGSELNPPAALPSRRCELIESSKNSCECLPEKVVDHSFFQRACQRLADRQPIVIDPLYIDFNLP